MKYLLRQSPGRIIALGFAAVILLGSLLLMMPFSVWDNVSIRYIDALYTSTSAVCVTGLTVVDTADTFTPIGQAIVALLIQTGGLGVTSMGAGMILLMGKRFSLKGRLLIREALNLNSVQGVVRFLKSLLFTTILIEGIGVVLSFFVFIRDFPPLKALGISVFHSIAAFNNAGFDNLGNFQNLIPYQSNVLLNLTTCFLIITGGLGFLVLLDIWHCRFHFRKLRMHSKVVISVSAVLIVVGTLLLKFSEHVSWLGAFFFSVSARTAGFSTYPVGGFTNAGLIVLIVLMFVGASPGSTGGGIKTSTLFVLLQGIKSAASNKNGKVFHYSIPTEMFRKAAVLTLLALGLVMSGTYLLALLEPEISVLDLLFEVTSAFGTVGLSTGISPDLCDGAKAISIIIMYIGRLGPLTVATLWYFGHEDRVHYPTGTISIG